jgi:mono/diheme cytochrome c family protein
MMRLLASFQVVGALLAYGGYRWWEHVLPEPVRAIFLGGKALLPALASTRHLVLWALTVYLLLALFALAFPRLNRWPSAVAALLAAFVFFGGYERLREGSRKPFVIRDFMFSNGVLISEIPDLNQRGILSKAVWAVRENPGPEGRGLAVFRAQCASCHTIDGYLSIRKLVAPVDPDMLNGILTTMRDEGNEYTSGKYTHQGHVATDKLDYPLMPPLVGTEDEVGALASYLLSLKTSHVAEAPNAN